MKYSKYIFLILFCSIISYSSCASDKKVTGGKFIAGPAAPDIVNYVNQGILRIAELETKSLERYASVTDENYTTDQKVYEELKNFVVPTYKRFLDNLRDINPENAEVKKVHGIYVQSAESIYEGLKTKMIGIENDDDAIISQGQQEVEKGIEGIKKFRSELEALYKEQGVAQEVDK